MQWLAATPRQGDARETVAHREARMRPLSRLVVVAGLADRWAAGRARLVSAGVPASRLFALGFGATSASGAFRQAVPARIDVSRMR